MKYIFIKSSFLQSCVYSREEAWSKHEKRQISKWFHTNLTEHLIFLLRTNCGFLTQDVYSKISREHSHGSKLLVYHMKSLHTYYKMTSDIGGDHLLSSLLYSMLLLPCDLQYQFRNDDTWSDNNFQYIPWITSPTCITVKFNSMSIVT